MKKYSEQVHIGVINCAPPYIHQRVDLNVAIESTDTSLGHHGDKTVSVDPRSSRRINKYHLEGEFHLESDIGAVTKFGKL